MQILKAFHIALQIVFVNINFPCSSSLTVKMSCSFLHSCHIVLCKSVLIWLRELHKHTPCNVKHPPPHFSVFENLQWDLKNNAAFSVSSQSKCNCCCKLLTTPTSFAHHLKIPSIGVYLYSFSHWCVSRIYFQTVDRLLDYHAAFC